MKKFDYVLQQHRFRRVKKHLSTTDVVLDFGCHEGQLFKYISGEIAEGIGIDCDPSFRKEWDRLTSDSVSFVLGDVDTLNRLPEGFRPTVVVALAVVEHLTEDQLRQFGQVTAALVASEGRLLITMPSPKVDHILDIAVRARVLDGMDRDAHHGVVVQEVVNILNDSGWELSHWNRFQFGLNNEILFRKTD